MKLLSSPGEGESLAFCESDCWEDHQPRNSSESLMFPFGPGLHTDHVSGYKILLEDLVLL